jgi:hypothetical protein
MFLVVSEEMAIPVKDAGRIDLVVAARASPRPVDPDFRESR